MLSQQELEAIATITFANLQDVKLGVCGELHYQDSDWCIIDEECPTNNTRFSTPALYEACRDIFRQPGSLPDWQKIWSKFISREFSAGSLSVGELLWFKGLSNDMIVVESEDAVHICDHGVKRKTHYDYLSMVTGTSIQSQGTANVRLNRWRRDGLRLRIRETCLWLWALTVGNICGISDRSAVVVYNDGMRDIHIHVPCDFMLTLENFSVPYCQEQLTLLEASLIS